MLAGMVDTRLPGLGSEFEGDAAVHHSGGRVMLYEIRRGKKGVGKSPKRSLTIPMPPG